MWVCVGVCVCVCEREGERVREFTVNTRYQTVVAGETRLQQGDENSITVGYTLKMFVSAKKMLANCSFKQT